MKVKMCKQCKYYERRVWSQYYSPADYHAIGINHAYAYCKLYDCRCLSVKDCKVYADF